MKELNILKAGMSDAEIAKAIKAWRHDDEQGYDAALELLCDIETILERRQR